MILLSVVMCVPTLPLQMVFAHQTARALMWLVGPLASVMFPRIVHSAARSEKNNLMGLVLAGTAVLAISGAISLHFLGPWVVRFVNGAKYVAQVSALLPWYEMCIRDRFYSHAACC